MDSEIKDRKQELARIQKATSIENKVLDLDVGETYRADKIDLLLLGMIRTRLSRITSKFGRTFNTEVNGSSITITRIYN